MTAAMKLKDACSWKKNYDQPRDSILKSKDITLPTNVHIVKAMGFPVVMCVEELILSNCDVAEDS